MATETQNPAYYRTVMPYLILEDAVAFIDFTQKVFGAEVKMDQRDDEGQVRHAEIVIGDSAIMFGNSGGEWQPQPAGLYVNVNDADASYRAALEAGATSVMEPSDLSYGRSCGVRDSNGNTWWMTGK